MTLVFLFISSVGLTTVTVPLYPKRKNAKSPSGPEKKKKTGSFMSLSVSACFVSRIWARDFAAISFLSFVRWRCLDGRRGSYVGVWCSRIWNKLDACSVQVSAHITKDCPYFKHVSFSTSLPAFRLFPPGSVPSFNWLINNPAFSRQNGTRFWHDRSPMSRPFWMSR